MNSTLEIDATLDFILGCLMMDFDGRFFLGASNNLLLTCAVHNSNEILDLLGVAGAILNDDDDDDDDDELLFGDNSIVE